MEFPYRVKHIDVLKLFNKCCNNKKDETIRNVLCARKFKKIYGYHN